MHRDVSCFILAAGLGERMRPLTNHIPKPFLPLAGVPLVERILERLRSAGIERIAINSHHLHGYIAEWHSAAAAAKGIELFHEQDVLDTAGGLKNAESFLCSSDFLVHNGDILSDIDLSLLIERHKLSGNIATLALHDCSQFNNMQLNADGTLCRVYKEAIPADLKLYAFTGIAVYKPDILKLIHAGNSGLVQSWHQAIAEGYKIGTVDVTGSRWSDIGTPAAYAAAIADTLRQYGETCYAGSYIALPQGVVLKGHVIIEDGCDAGAAASLNNCILLPGARTATATSYENCIVGPDYKLDIPESAFLNISGGRTLIGVGGSDRRYYRVRDNERTLVLMECHADDPDYERHMAYTRFFRRCGIPVPAVISETAQQKSALFEDLGDMSLYSWLKFHGSGDSVELMYKKIMDILAALHCETTDSVAECPLLAARIFDYDYLRWETDYFVQRFIKGYRQLAVPEHSALDAELERLARETDSFTRRIIHRDFQSQNVMIAENGSPHIIDYQGARMAAPAYDIAAILFDPYARLRDDMRERLIDYYANAVTSRGSSWFSRAEFDRSLLCCRLQRHMQALGAYGFLSIEKGKRYFERHMPEAVRLLKDDLRLTRGDFPALDGLVNKL